MSINVLQILSDQALFDLKQETLRKIALQVWSSSSNTVFHLFKNNYADPFINIPHKERVLFGLLKRNNSPHPITMTNILQKHICYLLLKLWYFRSKFNWKYIETLSRKICVHESFLLSCMVKEVQYIFNKVLIKEYDTKRQSCVAIFLICAHEDLSSYFHFMYVIWREVQKNSALSCLY